MKEFKVRVELNNENKVISMEPLKLASGEVTETKIMIARILTQEEADREVEETMQDGVRAYKKVHGRIRETR